MLTASAAVQNTIKQSLAVTSLPRVLVEWNHNRYATVSAVDNWGYPEATYGYDLDTFPIEEIVKPFRPTSGILVAKTGEGVSTDGWSDTPGTTRAYTASPDAGYKYWTSPTTSAPTGDLTNCNPYVVYSAPVWANKIFICFENNWTYPTLYSIQVTTDGTNWTTVGSNNIPNSKGIVALYHQADSSWNTTPYYGSPTQLMGVRLVITALTRAYAHTNLIELGLRLQDDVTAYLMSYGVDMEVGQDDFISPIGTANSNSGNVVLSNLDGRFNNDAPAADSWPYYRGLIDMGALVTIDLGIDSSAYGGPGIEYIRQATMISDGWAGDDETSTISLKDYSKILQEVNPTAMLLQNVSIGEAIWRLLDSVGFNYYQYSRAVAESPVAIPFFWTDPTKTVWETIQDICRTTQTACYFDANGILQIKTRDATFDSTKIASPVWTFDDVLNGTKQPDIVTLAVQNNYEANHVTVHYRPTALAIDDQGYPAQEIVWQPGQDPDYPESDVVLRSSALRADMTASQMYMYISQTDSVTWPYDGMVNVRGELIRYKGKEYRYVDVNNNWQYTTLYSTDDKTHVDNDLSSPTLGSQNYFTGKLIIIERGYDWTTPASHDSTINSWLTAGAGYGTTTGVQAGWAGGLKHIPSESTLRITGAATWTSGIFYTAPRGNVGVAPNNIGTRIKFPSSPKGKHQIGGIFFYSNQGQNVMYTVEVMTTNWLESANLRTSRDEVMIVRRDSSGYTSITGRGRAMLISEDIWYDLDVTVNGSTFAVYLNGRLILTATDSGIASSGKLGLYIRGNTVMDAEYYYYAANAGWPNPDNDNSSYLDLIRGGYYSDQNYRDGYYRTRTARRKSGRRSTTYKQQYAQRFFDEFGILVHEVRPYTVKFSKTPVVYSDLYFSNTSQAVCIEYVGNCAGASFLLANASRDDAVINGADDLTFGSGNTVNQQMFVSGRTVQQQDEKTIEVKDVAAIRRRGDIPLDFSSDWLQTAGAAQQLADWIVSNWATPADQVDVTIFGNPLLEMTDVVAVNYAFKNMAAATHKYYITKIGHSWSDGGLETTVSLRRAR